MGRHEEEEGNWNMWVGDANLMVGDTTGAWMWAGRQQLCLSELEELGFRPQSVMC